MGICEAGFVPGAAFLMGSYYKRHEFQTRYSFFFSAAILAGAFSAFLAYLLSKLDGAGGYAGWRWIFLIEGILTCLIAAIAWWTVAPWPQNATFFSAEEKTVFLARLGLDGKADKEKEARRSRDEPILSKILHALRDWRLPLFTLSYFGADNAASSFASFQPTIVQGLGYTNPATANVMTIPVYMVALVMALSAAYASDRLRARYPFTLLATLLSITGWAIQRSQAGGPKVQYFSLFLTLGGTYILMPVLVVWLGNNMDNDDHDDDDNDGEREHHQQAAAPTAAESGPVPRRQATDFKRGFATALMIGCGNSANFVSANVFLPQEAPRYTTAYSVGLGLQAMSLLCCTLLAVGMWVGNRKARREGRLGRNTL